MECCYIVISSAHLSNGHFRNIKGVFRGPLGKNGSRTRDYAEKKNTIARALEDLKANFYCELCDKQYYKHQEFDNHINSYDHAHKQRLKELKQREFARNVASKSRKDERKQEKALQRLHRLAELRKERACAPGSGPMFKSTTVTVRDHGADVPQSAALDPADKGDSGCTVTRDTQDCRDLASLISSTPGSAGAHRSDPNKCGDQAQGAQGHRVGFSFAFPKKAAVKLESSAAVFYEYNDDTSAEHGFSRRSRFVPGAGNLQSTPVAVVPCLEGKQNCVFEKSMDAAEAPEAQESQEVANENSRVLETPTSAPAVSHQNQAGSSDVDGDGVDGSTAVLPDQMLQVVVDGAQVLPLGCSSYELPTNRALAQAAVEDCLSLQDVAEERDEGRNSDSSTAEAETKNLGEDALVPSPSEEGGSGAPQSKPDPRKRPCEPFVPVLSKHGSNVLQWPSEMLIYTRTDPSISYSCNPLYFDFRSSRASDSQEKPKHQPSIPHVDHKTEPSHGFISDCTNAPTSGRGDHEAGLNGHLCRCAIHLSGDVALVRSDDLAKSQHKASLDESFWIRQPERCHPSKNHLRQSTVLEEKYGKVWIKESREKWLHRSRKWKRRRKLCHCHYHHCGDTAVAEMLLSSVTEEEGGYKDDNKCQRLQSSPEKCGHDAGNVWAATAEVQRLHQDVGGENGRKMFTSPSDHAQRDRGCCDVWSAKSSVQHRRGCKRPRRKSKGSSRRQARQQAPSCRRHRLRYSRTCCSWKVRRLSCSPEHSYLGHCAEEKSPSQTQSMKRGYNVLTEEPEKSHHKRRQHAYSSSSSSSSDESSYGQTLSADECLQQAHAYRKAKGKHRRRKTRIPHLFLDRNARCDTSSPSKENSGNSALSSVGDLLTQDSQEEPNAAPKADLAADTEETMQLEESKSPLEADSPHVLEEDKLTACTATENVPSVSSDVTGRSDTAPDHGAPASASTQDVPQDEKRKENVDGCENPGPYKAPLPSRHLEQTPAKSYLCHYELAESLPHEKRNEVMSEWVQCSPGMFSSPPPLPFKEAHVHSHTFLTTEQLIAPFAVPEQTLIFPPDNHDKFKDLPSEPYQQIIPQNVLANKVKFTFPPPAIQPPTSPLQPLPLQPPLCSTSITTIHHTILQQHAAAASTLKVLQPHQQFLSQVPALSRAPLPHLPVGPRLCPGGHATFVTPPHLPLLPPSVLHPTQLAFSPLPPTVFPSLLSPHPAVIPLQPLF